MSVLYIPKLYTMSCFLMHTNIHITASVCVHSLSLFPYPPPPLLSTCVLSRVGLSDSQSVPVFVCTMAFPSLPSPLHVFEPRYRLMIRRCETGSRRFGMCQHTEAAGYVRQTCVSLLQPLPSNLPLFPPSTLPPFPPPLFLHFPPPLFLHFPLHSSSIPPPPPQLQLLWHSAVHQHCRAHTGRSLPHHHHRREEIPCLGARRMRRL